MRANFVMSGVGLGIRRNLTMTIALVLSTAIALAFVGTAILANIEISRFKANYEGKLNTSVYLCATVNNPPCVYGRKTTAAQTADIERELKSYPEVTSVKYVSEQEQFARLKETASERVLAQSKPGDLPASFTVKLKDISKDYEKFVRTFSTVVGISVISNQIDTIRSLLDIIDAARIFSIVIAAVVLIASILLIANTIQVAAQQRRNETSIMRLVGASRWMTELPFMIETIIASAAGGLIAFGLVAIGKHYALNDVFAAQTRNGVIPSLTTNDLVIASGIGLISGIVLSAIVALATLRLYVRL